MTAQVVRKMTAGTLAYLVNFAAKLDIPAPQTEIQLPDILAPIRAIS